MSERRPPASGAAGAKRPVVDDLTVGLTGLRARIFRSGATDRSRGGPQWARLGVFLIVAGLSPLLVHGDYQLGIATLVLVYVIVSLGFYLVFCLTGQFAFSQAAMFGLGAYATAWAERFTGFWLALVLGVLITAAVGAVLLLVVHRASELYFAIATLGFAEVAILLFQNWPQFTGTGGDVQVSGNVVFFGVNVSTAAADFWLVFAFAAVALVLVKLIELSPLRREAIAVRDHERIAQGLGMSTLRVRVVMFALGCAFAAVGGGLFAQTQGFVAPNSFAVSLGIDIFLIVILGGTGSMWGCVIGSVFVVVLPELFRSAATYSALVFAGVLLAAIFLMPQGFVGMTQPVRTALRRVAGRRPPAAGGSRTVPPSSPKAAPPSAATATSPPSGPTGGGAPA